MALPKPRRCLELLCLAIVVSVLVYGNLFRANQGAPQHDSAPHDPARARTADHDALPAMTHHNAPMTRPVATTRPRPTATTQATTPKAPGTPPGYGQCQPSAAIHRYQNARFETTKGDIVVQLRPDLAPHGVQHFLELHSHAYYANRAVPFGRVNKWATQFGADERETRTQFAKLRDFPNGRNRKKDDNPCKGHRWEKGVMAMLGGPHILFVREANNNMGVADDSGPPAGFVIEGIEVLATLYEYNDNFQNSGGGGPREDLIFKKGGMVYLKERFPLLDFINQVRLENATTGP